MAKSWAVCSYCKLTRMSTTANVTLPTCTYCNAELVKSYLYITIKCRPTLDVLLLVRIYQSATEICYSAVFYVIIVKKLSSLKRLLRTTSATRRSKTANIKKKMILLCSTWPKCHCALKIHNIILKHVRLRSTLS